MGMGWYRYETTKYVKNVNHKKKSKQPSAKKDWRLKKKGKGYCSRNYCRSGKTRWMKKKTIRSRRVWTKQQIFLENWEKFPLGMLNDQTLFFNFWYWD